MVAVYQPGETIRIGARRHGVRVSGGGGGEDITWLWQAKFTADEAAPLASPQNADIGTLTLTDSQSRYSKSGGALVRAAGAAGTAWIDPQIYSTETFANAVGLAAYTRLSLQTMNAQGAYFGFDNKINANPANLLGTYLEYNELRPNANGGSVETRMQLGVETVIYADPTYAETLVISRNAGAIYLQRFKASQWRVAWVDDAVTGTPLRWRFNDTNRPLNVDEAGIGQLIPATWLDRFGKATNRTATTSNGSTTTAEADALVYHTITAATGVTQELMVRRVDDSNCWIIRMSQGGSTIKMIEVMAGVETERASAAQTWTNAAAYRIGVILDKYTIRAFVGTSYKAEWTSARTNSTATGVKVSHAGTELTTWPLHVTLNVGSPTVGKSIFCVGDSKTYGQNDDTSPYANGQNGYPIYLKAALTTATGQAWDEWPKRIGRPSYGVNKSGGFSVKDVIDADLATRYDAPDFILVNLGINDGTNGNGDFTTWITDYQYILDTLHNKYPDARVLVAKPAGQAGDWTAMCDTHIPAVISGRSWASLGPDERVVLGANWAGLTTDGVHPNHAGHLAMAAAWQTAMGY